MWKPAISWRIHRIEVLNPIQWFSVRRNEVASKILVRHIQTAMRGSSEVLALNIEDDRQQRAGLILRNVAYKIYGSFSMTERAGEDDNRPKFEAMFERRAAQGQSFHQPYLGCREFPCSFSLVTMTNDGKPAISESRHF